jgi:predicted ATPase
VPVDQPIICPVLSGRTADLTVVERALAQALDGRGQTLLVAGEAGIGKSRLVTETKATAERLGFAVLEGHCFESDRTLPFGPLIDLLRGQRAGGAPEDVGQDLGAAGPEVVKLLPEFATLVPGLFPSAPLEPEQEKRRLFHTLARLLSEWATVRPGRTRHGLGRASGAADARRDRVRGRAQADRRRLFPQLLRRPQAVGDSS